MKKLENLKLAKKVEDERRFIPGVIPDEIMNGIMSGKYEKILIHQGYTEDGLRLRHELHQGKEIYFATRKTGEGQRRIEAEAEISHEQFVAGWNDVVCQLWKERFLIPHGDYVIELNFFLGNRVNGYVQIEVEFKTKALADAFKPLPWFDREVTNDRAHNNYNIARHGAPYRRMR